MFENILHLKQSLFTRVKIGLSRAYGNVRHLEKDKLSLTLSEEKNRTLSGNAEFI